LLLALAEINFKGGVAVAIMKKLKCNKGQSLVLVVISMLVMLGFSGLVVDVGNVYLEKVRLQNAVDAAALAGGQELLYDGNSSQATTVAGNYMNSNYSLITTTAKSYSATYPWNGSNTQINVSVTKAVSTYFMKIFGNSLKTVDVSATATAKVYGDEAFEYAIFSGSKVHDLTLDAKSTVHGKVHTNQNLIIKNNTVVTGTCEYVGTILNQGTIAGQQQTEVKSMPNLNYNNAILNQAIAGGTIIGDYTTTATTMGSKYIQKNTSVAGDTGSFTASGSNFSDTGILVADGDITLNGSTNAVYQGTYYSRNGNITINGNGATFNGIVYAPKGTVTFNGSSQTVNGSVVADVIIDNGAKFTVDYVDYSPVLPYVNVKLIQ